MRKHLTSTSYTRQRRVESSRGTMTQRAVCRRSVRRCYSRAPAMFGCLPLGPILELTKGGRAPPPLLPPPHLCLLSVPAGNNVENLGPVPAIYRDSSVGSQFHHRLIRRNPVLLRCMQVPLHITRSWLMQCVCVCACVCARVCVCVCVCVLMFSFVMGWCMFWYVEVCVCVCVC